MAKRIVELKSELNSLRTEERNYQFIKDFRCQTDDEFLAFKRENLIAFERLEFIRHRIREIEWEVMSEEEKRNSRLSDLGLVEKFIDENDNFNKSLYMKNYIELVDLLDRMLKQEIMSATLEARMKEFLNELQRKKFHMKH